MRRYYLAAVHSRMASAKSALSIAGKIIDDYQGPSTHHFSALTYLMEDEPGGPPKPRKQLCEEVSSLMNATFASTAATFAWMLQLLGNHPNIKAKLLEELSVFSDADAKSLAGFSKLTYARQVIDETMRLYPAIPVLKIRRALQKEQVNGCHVGRGQRVVVSPYITHRDPSHWPDPEKFYPDRFSQKAFCETIRSRFSVWGWSPFVPR